MIIEQLIKRPPRERKILAASLALVVLVASYLSIIAPTLESLAGVQSDLDTTQSGLELQERQLTSLRAETVACQKVVAQLKDMPCPWISPGSADGLLQEFQKEAADLGLSVRSVIRERSQGLKLKDAKVPISLMMVRLEVTGPYAGVMELLRRLDKRLIAVGVEDLNIHAGDQPPFEVELSLQVKIPVVEGGKNG